MKKKLHPAVKISWRIGSYIGMIFLIFFFFMWGGLFIGALWGLLAGIGFIFGLLILWVIFIEIWVRLAYNRWFYEFTPDNLKIESGVIFKRYSNVPYERVQNVDIRRGIIARMFGFSAVNIQTAGYHYGGQGGFGSEGHIPAVDMQEAENIRDFLMKKISRKHSNSGL